MQKLLADDISIYSVKDVVETLNRLETEYPKTPDKEQAEELFYMFASELTGISIDSLAEMAAELQQTEKSVS